MYEVEDIPHIPDQSQRIQAVTVDCYNQAEELATFEVYFTDAMQFPFAATWRDPDEAGHAEPVTVLGLDSVDQRWGILLRVQRGDKGRRLLAEQVWQMTKTASMPPFSTTIDTGLKNSTG